MSKANCCEAAREGESLTFEAPSALYPGLPTTPRWMWETDAWAEGTSMMVDVDVSRCPFCGAELPPGGPPPC